MKKPSHKERGNSSQRNTPTRRRSQATGTRELHDTELAAGFLLGKKTMATLAQMRDPSVPTLSLGELSEKQFSAVVAHRLRHTAAKRPAIRMLGVSGLIDNTRAINEVEALSVVGKAIIDIERRFIRMLLESRRM